MKRSFHGAWPTWGKVPNNAKDCWFEEFQKHYTWRQEDHQAIRAMVEHRGSIRLSNTLNKAKKKYESSHKVPEWISENAWNELLQYWNTEDFKHKSTTNSKNRAGADGCDPSLHTGGSIPVSEYKRKFVQEKGMEPTASDLFLMVHKTKASSSFVDSKSKSIWAKYKSQKHHEGDSVKALAENKEVEDEEFMEMATNLSKDEMDSAWLETVGGPSKGRVYGLGSEGPSVTQGSIFALTFSSSTPPNSSFRQDSNFKEAVQEAVAEQLADIKASFERVQQEQDKKMQAM